MVHNENDVCRHLNIPSIPKKEWDGKKHFKFGVGVTQLTSGLESYAVVRYNENDKRPTVIKTFAQEPFTGFTKIYPIPQYLEQTDYEELDLDETSKERMKLLDDEAKEMENENVVEELKLPKHEYYFKHINNDDEAKAFIKSYNKQHKLNARVPKDHQGLIMRLSVIWAEENDKK